LNFSGGVFMEILAEFWTKIRVFQGLELTPFPMVVACDIDAAMM
jgi:hypothetical protein